MKNTHAIGQFPQKLPGSLWGITTYFNPNQYKNKSENYRIFRQMSQHQGLRLICVELAFGNRPFELTQKDADILIQRRTNSVMWQKERLLNIALKNLPQDCDKVAWIDADIIFQNNNWIKETSDLLELYKVVQPFEYALMLPPGVSEWDKNTPVEQLMGKAFKAAQPDKATISNDVLFGHPGFAWASRRDSLERTGFYDKMILGWGDFVLVSGFYQEGLPAVHDVVSPVLAADAQNWEKTLYEQVRGSVYYARGNISHLWHGDRPFRLFHERLTILSKYKFIPQDIHLNQDECWEWATWKPRLHWWVAGYFQRRNEENSSWDRFWAQIGNFWDFEKDPLIRHQIAEFKKFLRKLTLAVSVFIKNVILRVSQWVKIRTLQVLRGLDWSIGQVGLFLKRHTPQMYYFLKKFKGE